MFEFRRFIRVCARHPLSVLIVLGLISLLAASQLGRLEVRVDADEMFVKGDPAWERYQQLRKDYGEDVVSLLVIQDQQLFTKARLGVIRDQLEAIRRLPFVSKIDSLYSVPRLRIEEGFLKHDAYLASLPESGKQTEQLLESIDANRFLKHVLVSADHQTMALAIVSDPNSGIDETEQQAQLATQAEALTKHLDKAFVFSAAQVRLDIARAIEQEQGTLLPYGIAALMIALFLLLRQLVDVSLPVATAGLSILWTLGAMALLGIPLNVVTSIVPVLLIIVGSTEDIHLISEFRQAQRVGMSVVDAIGQMADKMGRIVTLTFVTTFLGFASVALSEIEMLRQFGLVAALGLLLNFAITLALIPAVLALVGQWRLDGRSKLYDPHQGELAERYWVTLRGMKKPVFGLLVILASIAAIGAAQIRVNHDPMDALPDDAEARTRLAVINDAFAGMESLSIVIDSGIQDTFLKIRYLDELTKIQKFIEQTGPLKPGSRPDAARTTPTTGVAWAKSTTSFADYLALLNAAFEEFDLPVMPDADSVVNELMLFLSHEQVAAYVSEDYSQARILVRHQHASTPDLEAFVEALNRYLDEELDSGLRAELSGHSVLALSATRAMLWGQAESILLLMLIIIALIAVLFAQLRVGLLAALPNIFPVLVLFGVMGYADIPLNIGTTMAAAIAIGLAVDDTLHFMLRYNSELKIARNQNLAMIRTIHHEALPVASTSFAMIAGFLVFLASDFPPVREFGLLSAIAIGAALFADLVITPLLISSTRLVTLWDLLSGNVRREVLNNSTLFDGLNEGQIRRFLSASRMHSLSRGETLFRTGETADTLYLVTTGHIDAVIPGVCEGQPGRVVQSFQPGDVLGDVALFADEQRKTDAVARDPTHVVAITRENMQNFLKNHPSIGARIATNLNVALSRRIVKLIAAQSKNQTCPQTDTNSRQ